MQEGKAVHICFLHCWEKLKQHVAIILSIGLRSYGLKKTRTGWPLHSTSALMKLCTWRSSRSVFYWGRVLWMFPVLRSVSTGRYKEWSPQRTHWQPSLCSGERWREMVVEKEGMKEKEVWWKEKERATKGMVGERGTLENYKGKIVNRWKYMWQWVSWRTATLNR